MSSYDVQGSKSVVNLGAVSALEANDHSTM